MAAVTTRGKDCNQDEQTYYDEFPATFHEWRSGQLHVADRRLGNEADGDEPSKKNCDYVPGQEHRKSGCDTAGVTTDGIGTPLPQSSATLQRRMP